MVTFLRSCQIEPLVKSIIKILSETYVFFRLFAATWPILVAIWAILEPQGFQLGMPKSVFLHSNPVLGVILVLWEGFWKTWNLDGFLTPKWEAWEGENLVLAGALVKQSFRAFAKFGEKWMPKWY